MEKMQKRTKAGLAAGGAAVLLMGGLGTAALWSDSETAGAGTISTGTLDIKADTADAWVETSTGSDQAFDLGTDRIVPGDVLESAQTFTVDAAGKNLLAALSVDYVDDASASLPEGVEVTLGDITLDGAPFDPDTDRIDEGAGQKLAATIKVTFDESVANQTSINETLDLEDIRVTVTQVRP